MLFPFWFEGVAYISRKETNSTTCVTSDFLDCSDSLCCYIISPKWP